MDCKIVEDLLPLYVDGCCTEETRRAVEAHIAACSNCRKALEAMGRPLPTVKIRPSKNSRVKEWKASILQSVLLFLSFGIITLGVSLEAGIPSGLLNGFWAFTLVVPATGFLLSLANWYFLRLYHNRRTFCLACCLMTVATTVLCYAWALWHYEWTLPYLLFWARLHIVGILLAVLLCGVSWPLAGQYAKLLGKE